MERGLAEAAPEVFSTASDVLGVDVVQLCGAGRAGPAELGSTRWAQPAVLVCSVAAFRALVERGRTFVAAAGHSVGEYAALVVSGALRLADALRLVGDRAEATEDAARATPGGMAAVMRIERSVIEEICGRTGISLAADNSEGQFVVSGANDALDRALESLGEAGAKCRRLEVAGAFHSQVMTPAVTRLKDALRHIPFARPRIDVWSSTTAAPMGEGEVLERTLLDQLVAPVRWRETVAGLAKAYGNDFMDLGPGKVVGGLARRIVAGAEISYASELIPAGTGGAS
jgi:[acyl-carrier-protein] S-malonyltransferase